MTDTITCPNCSAQLPAAASFCTNCGGALSGPVGETSPPPAPTPPEPTAAPAPAPAAEPTPPPASPPPADSTRVDTPGLHDSTQVYSPPPAATGPWEPAPGITPNPPPADGGWGQPQPPPAAPDQPLAPPPGAWGQPAPAGAPTWQPAGDPAQPTTGASATSSSPIGAAAAVVGGVLAIVGTFLVWVTNNITDAGLSGWDLTSGDKGFLVGGRLLTLESPDPYIIVGLGAVAVVIGVLLFIGTSRNVMRIAAMVVGVAIVGLLARDWTSMASVISDNAPSSFEISAAPGFYLVGAGGVITALAALLPAKK